MIVLLYIKRAHFANIAAAGGIYYIDAGVRRVFCARPRRCATTVRKDGSHDELPRGGVRRHSAHYTREALRRAQMAGALLESRALRPGRRESAAF